MFRTENWSIWRLLRISIFLGIFGLAGWWILPLFYSHISVKSIVNTKRINVRSPIEGTLTKNPPPRSTEIQKGTILTRIQNQKVDPKEIARITAELEEVQQTVQSLETQKRHLERMEYRLENRMNQYREQQKTLYLLDIQSSRTRIQKQKEKIEQLNEKIKRIKYKNSENLFESPRIGETYLEETRSRKQSVLRSIDVLRQQIRKTWTKLEALGKQIFLDAGTNDVPYSQQRLDQLQNNKAELTSRKAIQKRRVQALKNQLNTLQQHRKNIQKDRVKAARSGLVWRRHEQKGAHIRQHQILLEMIDCSEIFVQAVVPERHFQSLSYIDTAYVQFLNADKKWEGTIESVVGGAAAEDHLQVARKPNVGQGELLVIISLPQEAFSFEGDRFCGVGRSAVVTFPYYPGLLDILYNVL